MVIMSFLEAFHLTYTIRWNIITTFDEQNEQSIVKDGLPFFSVLPKDTMTAKKKSEV